MIERGNAAGGYAPALECGGRPFGPTPLRYSVSWPVAKLASLTAFVALEQSRRVRRRCALTRAATSPAFLSAANVAASAHPPTALPPTPCLSSNTTSVAARWAGGRPPLPSPQPR